MVRTVAHTNSLQRKEIYKAQHDKRVLLAPSFPTGDNIFIDLKLLKVSPVERLATKVCTKLLSPRLGPCLIIIKGQEYVRFW